MKKVTVWEMKTPQGEWEHNHIEDGWSERDAPQGKDSAQVAAWRSKEWKLSHKYLDDENVIR